MTSKDALENIVGQDEAVRKDFDAKGVDTGQLCQENLRQIVFLYFLQKKGWFGVARNNPWGTGPKNFLRRLFDKKKYGNFFNDILSPFFMKPWPRNGIRIITAALTAKFPS